MSEITHALTQPLTFPLMGDYRADLGGVSRGGGGVEIVDLDTPTLTLVSGATDSTPNFDVGIPASTHINDVIRVQSNNGSGWVDYVTYTIVDLGSGTFNVSSVTPLSDGSYTFKDRMERGLHVSAYSATTSGSIDTTAPTITTASTANVNEGSSLSISLTASESVSWSITGGADSARYEISGSTLRWASNGTKLYLSPDDADTNNTYIVQVTATDAAGNATNKTITTTVIQLPFVPRDYMVGGRFINQTGNRQWQSGSIYNVEN